MTVLRDLAVAVGTEFTAEEYDETYPPGYELHYWHRARSSVLMDRVRAACKKEDTVLEIGAGRGHYVRTYGPPVTTLMAAIWAIPASTKRCVPSFLPARTAADLDPDLRRRVTAVLLLDVNRASAEFIASVFQGYRRLPC